MAKKPLVAGSTQEPATIITAGNLSEVVAEGSAAATVMPDVQSETLSFPRDIFIVNETAMNYVVARKYVSAGATEAVSVNDDDEITRIKTDCEQIMSLNDTYAGMEVSPLRVTEAQ